MTASTPLLVIAFAGLLHASFQLGVSLLTLLGGHSLGLGRSHQRLMRLNLAYLFGAAVITILLFAGLAYFSLLSLREQPQLTWLVFSVLTMVIGLAVMVFYYRRGQGTGLWIPRPMAQYLTRRIKKTTHPAEAFTLGAGSVLAEAPFLIGPLGLAILYTVSLGRVDQQLVSFALYSLIGLAPLYVIVALIGVGHKISQIQRWREDNKLFLQYCAGSGLIILGAFVFVDQVIGGYL